MTNKMNHLNCYDASMLLSFVKEIRYHLWTHDNETGIETLKNITAKTADYSTRHYEVMMISAVADGVFEVYGYREVN